MKILPPRAAVHDVQPKNGTNGRTHIEPDLPHSAALNGTSLATSSGLARRSPRDWRFSETDEIYRRFYTQPGTGTLGTLAVCSAIAGEGKTSICVGLATAFAQDFPEHAVAVVETDLRRPVLARHWGLTSSPGLVEWLLGDGDRPDPYHPTFLPNLVLVPGGCPPASPSRVIRSRLMRDGIRAIRADHDFVILDVPALLGNSDGLRLIDLADRVLFVVRSGVTPLPLVEEALQQIDQRKLYGIVLNGRHSAIPTWLRRLIGK